MTDDEYRWSVFVSYPNTGSIGPWVRELLVPILEDRLKNYGVTTPKIFVDQACIRDGTSWPKELAEAHARARTYLFVLSAPTIDSGWCRAEIKLGFTRQRKVPNSPLCFVIRYNDFKEENQQRLDSIEPGLCQLIRAQQYRDWVHMNELCPEDVGQKLHRKFREEVSSLAEAMSHTINDPPPFDPDLPRLPEIAIPGHSPDWGARLGDST